MILELIEQPEKVVYDLVNSTANITSRKIRPCRAGKADRMACHRAGRQGGFT
jgi:hypothetical protein